MTELSAIALLPGFLLLVKAPILLRSALRSIGVHHGTLKDHFLSAAVAQPSVTLHDTKDFILNNVGEAVICLDRDWRYTYLNDAALSTNPAGKASCLGRTIWEVHPEATATKFYDIATKVMQGRTSAEFDFHYLPLDCWFAVRIYPTGDGLVIFRKDISAEKNASQFHGVLPADHHNSYLLETDLLDTIIDTFPGVFYLFTRKGRILKWNQRMEKISGYSPEDIRRMTPFDFVPASEHALVRQKMETVFQDGQDVVQLPFLQKSGETTPFFFTGRAVMYEGEPCLMGVGIDCSEKVRTQSEITSAKADLRELSRRLQDIRAEERKGIARDIHDDLGQLLTAIKLSVFRLEGRVAGDTGATEIVHQILELAGMGIESIRRISTGLRPEILDDMGLEPAIKWLVEEFERRFSIPVTLAITGADDIDDPLICSNCLRILQEALTNIARHASATAVEVNFSAAAGAVALLIRDDGKGLDPDTRKGTHRLGLRGIKERAAAVGGRLTIDSDSGAGTRIRVDIPLHKTSHSNAHFDCR